MACQSYSPPRLEPSFVPKLFQNKTCLRHGTFISINNKNNPVNHFHDTLYFSTKIRMSWCVHNVNTYTIVGNSSIFARIVIPRSFSRSLESIARSSNFLCSSSVCDCFKSSSTRVVFPWSTWAMIATFLISSKICHNSSYILH